MSWTAIIGIAVGAYLLKLGGVAIGTGRLRQPLIAEQDVTQDRLVDRLGQLIPPAVLFGLIVSQTVSTNGALAADARLVGVGFGALAAWRKAPFWAVLVVSAASTAAFRWCMAAYLA